jgi:hypothetical protein
MITEYKESYLDRVMRSLSKAFRMMREGKMHEAASFCLRKCWGVSDTILFEKTAGASAEDSRIEGLRIVRVDGQEDALNKVAIRTIATEGWGDIENFEKHAVCYLAYLHDQPVAVGWRFVSSRLLTSIGYPASAAYLGSFYVVESVRGRGIYPAMLRFMCADVPLPKAIVVVQTVPHNLASQQGLAKAGFTARWHLRTWTLVGLIVRWRLEPWTSLS